MGIITPQTNTNEVEEKSTMKRRYANLSSMKYTHLKALAAKELGLSEKTVHICVTEKDIENELTQKEFDTLNMLITVAENTHSWDFSKLSFSEIQAIYEKDFTKP